MKNKILFLLKNQKINFWDLVSEFGPLSSVACLVKTLKQLKKEGLIEIKDSFLSLTQKGEERVKKIKDFFQRVNGRLYNYDFLEIDRDILEKFERLRRKGLTKEQFDQLQILPLGVMRKLEIMKRKGDLKGKKIVCLGDDDMVGAALALINLTKEIIVLDIDKEIVEYENKIFKELGVKGKAFQHNLLNPIPSFLKNKCDVFVTEPPDTVFGNSLFFSRGVECVRKEGGVGYLGISETDFSREKFFQVEKNILKMGGVITDIYEKLEPYEIGNEKSWVFNLPPEFGWPNKPWFFSNLLRVEILKNAKPLFKGKVPQNISKKLISTHIYC